jgi:hypothetical protein
MDAVNSLKKFGGKTWAWEYAVLMGFPDYPEEPPSKSKEF